MKLHVGERLPGTGPAQQPGGYVITGVVSETPWHGLYSGKKIFYNFDFTSKRPREADEREWLDVFLRTINYARLNDAEYVTGRRALARAEARHILGQRSSNLWPEPLEVLEVVNTRDPFSFARELHTGPTEAGQDALGLEPILVFARPHGQLLGDWQQNVLPLSSILSVLAELLDFISLAHDEGLFLRGLGPASVLVDRADRVYYLGTDMVKSESAQERSCSFTVPLSNGAFFPAERFPRGFAAPECFTTESRCDRCSDLYAWGALAYLLLTGDRPAEIARQQGQAWAYFQAEHFLTLEKALRGVPPAHARAWAEQMGLDPEDLVAHWPGNVLSLFRLLLSAEARRRPPSVADLRSWVLAPPPPPAVAVLALRSGADEARIHLDLSDIDSSLEIVVRRGVGAPPASPADGALVADGPQRTGVEDRHVPSGDVHYVVFVRKRQGKEVVFSLPTSSRLIDPSPGHIVALAEDEFPAGAWEDPEPAGLALLFRALDPVGVAAALLPARAAHVRGWAIRRLVQMQQGPGNSAAADNLLWQALRDPEQDLRLHAARGLLQASGPPGVLLVKRVAEALGPDGLDDAIEAAHALAHIGLSDGLIRQTVDALEEDRPTACPECAAEVPRRERTSHLIRVHGYVDVFGTLWPRAPALARFWDRVLVQGDVQAHQRLLELLADPANQGPKATPELVHSYAGCLEADLLRRDRQGPERSAAAGTLWPRSFLDHVVHCFRQASAVSTAAPHLLCSAEARVREVGRECLLADLRQRLTGAHIAAAADIRRLLDQAVGPACRTGPELAAAPGAVRQAGPAADLLEEKILLCARLTDFGVDAGAVASCLAQLQDERLVHCIECGTQVRLADLESHLRREHEIFQFRGTRRSYQDTRAAILDALCGSSPDYAAWKTLEAIAHERHAEQADARLVGWLLQKLRTVPREPRSAALGSLAEAITAAGSGARLLAVLVLPLKIPMLEAVSRLLALEIATRLPPPVAGAALTAVQPLLSDRRLPRDTRQAAVAALLRTTGHKGEPARALLQAYVAGVGKLRAIEKLHQLEQRVGPMPAIDGLCGKLEDQVRMDCPRCATQLPRVEMVQHLWDRHRLVLEGRRVREPWRVIEDWIEDYRLEKDAAVLHRCRDLARRLDPDQGPLRLQRLLLRHGVEDAEALAAVLSQARRDGASLCPHCYTEVPVPVEPVPPSLELANDSLDGEGFHVDVSERGLVPSVAIEGPHGVIYEGRQPGRLLTRNGFLAFFVGPLVLLAFVLTEVVTGSQLHPALTISGALGVGLFLAGLVYVAWPLPASQLDRLVDLAWTLLVPELHARRFQPDEAAFVAGLAQLSLHSGRPGKRAEALEAVRDVTEDAFRQNTVPVSSLAVLWRLTIADLHVEGEDAVDALAAQVARCFSGKMPLRFAGELLHGIMDKKVQPAWSAGQLERLRVLLCGRAFKEGLEVSDLVDLGRAEPSLGKALAVDNLDGLAQRRLLWSQRETRPWERWGDAATVFELAAEPAREEFLARFPDLLLAVGTALPIYICCRGVFFEDLWITDMPHTIEIVSRRLYQDDEGYDLVIDKHRLWFDNNPERTADRLEGWLRYCFREFRPHVQAVHLRRSPEVVKKLQARNASACPSCRQHLLPRAGQLGVALEEPLATTWAVSG